MQLIALVISVCRIYRGIIDPFHIMERGPSRTGRVILTYYSKNRIQRVFMSVSELRDHCDDHRISAASVIHTSHKSSLRPLLWVHVLLRCCEYTCTYVVVSTRAPTLLMCITLIEVDGNDHSSAHQLS